MLYEVITKARNLKILNNTFISEFAGKDMIHLEEFTNNVLVKGNTFKLTGVDVDGLITVGAQQSSYNIDIIDNVVEQNVITSYSIHYTKLYDFLLSKR